MNAKSQSSLEYLSTYGWVLILIITAGSILFFVLSPKPEFSFNINTKDFIIRSSNIVPGTPTTFTLEIQNASGKQVTINSISGTNLAVISPSFPIPLTSGQILRIEGIIENPSASSSQLVIDYTIDNYAKTAAIESKNTLPSITSTCNSGAPDNDCSPWENCPQDSSDCEQKQCQAVSCLNGCQYINLANGTICGANKTCQNGECITDGTDTGSCQGESCTQNCGNETCETGENCPADSDNCPAQECKTAVCSNGCQYTNLADGTNCAENNICINGSCVQSSCGDSVCFTGENCRDDTIGCQTELCKTATCSNGCEYFNLPNGSSCGSNKICQNGECICLPSKICGSSCCSSGQVCQDNACTCQFPLSACGDTCCSMQTQFCINNACCNKLLACNNFTVCCPGGTVCTGGNTCCPGERACNSFTVCCPESTKCINNSCVPI